MVTTPTPTLTDEEKALAVIAATEREAAWVRAERIAFAQSMARSILTGGDSLPWRRPILFLLVGIGLALNAPAIGFAGLLLLAYTDNVIDSAVEE